MDFIRDVFACNAVIAVFVAFAAIAFESVPRAGLKTAVRARSVRRQQKHRSFVLTPQAA